MSYAMRWMIFGFFAVLLAGGFTRGQEPVTGSVALSFSHEFNGQALVVGNQLYALPEGDSLSLDVVRYYITHVTLLGKQVYHESDSYHLIDAEEPVSQQIMLRGVPVGRYDSLSFYVGTDSLANVSGAMGNDLDPSLGMYWAWNSGYINVKLEGRSKACPTRRNAFEFHLGGYLPPHQTLRKVVLPLKKLSVRPDVESVVTVHAELSQFFRRISLQKTNQVMIPGKLAAELATFYQSVFALR